jgi:hypothetical protein
MATRDCVYVTCGPAVPGDGRREQLVARARARVESALASAGAESRLTVDALRALLNACTVAVPAERASFADVDDLCRWWATGSGDDGAAAAAASAAALRRRLSEQRCATEQEQLRLAAGEEEEAVEAEEAEADAAARRLPRDDAAMAETGRVTSVCTCVVLRGDVCCCRCCYCGSTASYRYGCVCRACVCALVRMGACVVHTRVG